MYRRGVTSMLLGLGDHHLLRHVADALVEHHHDGYAEFLGQVESRDGEVETLLRGIGAERDDAVVAVRTPARLHHVGLRRQGGQAGGRPSALHVDEDAGRLRHGGVSDVLHHQGEAGAGGHREGFGAAPDGALDGDGGGQFVLHLNEDAADGRDSRGKSFDHLGGRRDRVACGKSRTGCERSLTAGMVAVEKMNTGEHAFRVSVHSALRRWRSPDSTFRTGRSRCTFSAATTCGA